MARSLSCLSILSLILCSMWASSSDPDSSRLYFLRLSSILLTISSAFLSSRFLCRYFSQFLGSRVGRLFSRLDSEDSSMLRILEGSIFKYYPTSPQVQVPLQLGEGWNLQRVFPQFRLIGKVYIIQLARMIPQEPAVNLMQAPPPQYYNFPTLTVYSCPRFYKGSIIADGRAPLTKFKNRIYANNCKQIIQEEAPEKTSIANFDESDKLLYLLGEMRRTEGFGNRGIKILVCVCMFNESRIALETTLKGIYAGLPALQEEGIEPDDIAVVVLQDGILKLVDDRVTRTFSKGERSVVEFYRELDMREGKERCHLVERINVVLDEIDNFNRKRMGEFVVKNQDFPPSIEKNLSLVYQNMWSPKPEDPVKLKLITCFKHINGTKLSSHLWFFEGFCRHINPEFCVLLDVGTEPDPKGIANLITAFHDKKIGGVTGLMSVDSNFVSEEEGSEKHKKKNCFLDAFASVEKAQEFEYIMAHFYDKNCESFTGFLHVLPGAWSAYRYEALVHSEKFEQNLLERKYFKMILDPNVEERDYKEANMYLAEDRILSLGIYCQQEKNYILKYIPNAIARTDPMKTLQDLMKQRRRWINSSHFAFEYVERNYYFNVMESSHNCCRTYFTLPLCMLLAKLSFLNGYFTPTFFFFTLWTTVKQSAKDDWIWYIANMTGLLYCLTVFVCVGGSLMGVIWTKHAWKASLVFTLFTFVMLGLVIWNVIYVYIGGNDPGTHHKIDMKAVIKDFESMCVFIMTCLNVGCYVLIVFMHLFTHPKFVWRLAVDSISYLVWQGCYSHVMVIYAFCNIDDVSWGTKGVKSTGKKKYQVEKVFFVANWLFWNAVLAFFFLLIDYYIKPKTKRGYILLGLGIYATAYLTFKTILATLNHLSYYLGHNCCKCCYKKKDDEFRKQKLHDFFRAIRLAGGSGGRP